MAYVTRDYYISGYLQGRSPAVPDTDFPFLGKQAERIIDSCIPTESRRISAF